MRKKLIFVILTVTIIMMGFILIKRTAKCSICGSRAHTIHSCIVPIGLPDGQMQQISYETLFETYGEPQRVEYEHRPDICDDTLMRVFYEGLTFRFYHPSSTEENPFHEKWRLFSISTTDSAYVFSKHIHVGCTRGQILWYFRNAMPIKDYEVGTAYWDYCQLWTIKISYDAHNRVDCITFSFY